RGICVVPAVGYRESLALTEGARAVITDSGGVQREAYWLGTPCITLRRETEWSETLALGANRVVAPERAATELAGAVAERVMMDLASWDRTAYGDGNAAERIATATRELLMRQGG
ncbi:MAG TPA: UDP-N-acetylglucosamine 2-epimerase, partial [Gemmatimonadales bacterium]|nr:UDP-N-acetylglucosamine 2-epimerase [Gemmatimonadales bacterium]